MNAATLKPPGAHKGIGLSLGVFSDGLACTLPRCEEGERSLRLYNRAMGEHWGAEVGLLDTGRIGFEGGSARAQGISLSVVGRMPLSASLSAYGKVGTTYSHTSSMGLPGSGLQGGSATGFGMSFGAGLSWQFSPRLSAVVELDSHDFRFANGGRDPVRAASLGLQWRY
ncbi:hypothetical protein EZ242_08600 [Ramlibacter rhizophilus]|uniref:Outer membrane protein beta-barrel domain-containing protein n=1 Tax=Ramlibacter rhizophilus TaxID=1781167 RepID=A0A4Z0BQ26_9BURK|nr:hypothetical protein EZ242_08600 [Ramlibacter rhizophilus]